MKDFHRNRDAAQGFSPDILFLPCIFPHFLQTAGPFGLLLSLCSPPFTMNLQERPQTLVGRSPVRSHTLPLLQQICVNRWTKYMKHQAIHCNTNTSDGKALKKKSPHPTPSRCWIDFFDIGWVKNHRSLYREGDLAPSSFNLYLSVSVRLMQQ